MRGVWENRNTHLYVLADMQPRVSQSLLLVLFSTVLVFSVGFLSTTQAASVEDRGAIEHRSQVQTAGVLDAFRGITDAIVAPFRAIAQAIVSYRDGDDSPQPPVRRIVEDEVDVLVYQDSATGEVQSVFADSLVENFGQSLDSSSIPSAYETAGAAKTERQSNESPWAFLFKRDQPQEEDPSPPSRTSSGAGQPQIQYQPRVSFAPSASQFITTNGFNPDLFNTTISNPVQQPAVRNTEPGFRRITRNQPDESGYSYDAPSFGNFHGVLSANADTFTITTDLNNSIQFVSASLDPLNVPVGATQTLSITLFSDHDVAKVSAISEMDTQLFELNLDNVSGGDGALVYQNAWDVFDTHSRTYRTTFRVEDTTGNVQTITLAWSDICRGISQGRDSSLQLDCSQSRLTGLDGGTLTIPRGKTMTLLRGADFVYNPGSSPKINGYLAVSNSRQPASLRSGYLFHRDSDGDRWAQDFLGRYGASSSLGGHTRAKDFRSYVTTDCNDAAASASNTCSSYSEQPIHTPAPADPDPRPTTPAPDPEPEPSAPAPTPTSPAPSPSPAPTSPPPDDDDDTPIYIPPPRAEEEEEDDSPPVVIPTPIELDDDDEIWNHRDDDSGGSGRGGDLQTKPDPEPEPEEEYECNPIFEVCFTESSGPF